MSHGKARFLQIGLIVLFFAGEYTQANVRVGVFDISFWGIESVLRESMTSDFTMPSHNLYSPHGVAVSSLIFLKEFGGSPHANLALANPGIYPEDFERGVALAINLNVRLINVSMRLISPRVVEIINRTYEKHGIVFIVSAGNSAHELGRPLPPYYEKLKAVVVSCLDNKGLLPDFAQLDKNVDVLTDCGDKEVPSRINDPWRGIVDYEFGMTSAGTAKITATIVDLINQRPKLTLAEIEGLLHDMTPARFTFNGKRFPFIKRNP